MIAGFFISLNQSKYSLNPIKKVSDSVSGVKEKDDSPNPL
jgi:hypothetical protein